MNTTPAGSSPQNRNPNTKLQISAKYSTVPSTLAGISRAASTSTYCAVPPTTPVATTMAICNGSIAVQNGIEATPITSV